ncbi:MAG: hypothetical protein ABFD50_08185 [Smithella sp.]
MTNDLSIKEIPKEADQYTLYVDRQLGNINGFLTLQRVVNGQITKLFEKLPIRSGQNGFVNSKDQDFIRSKGSIPFGDHYLSTKKESLWMEPKGTPFYVVSSKPGERVIYGPSGKTRHDIGLHMENQFPGSAGCVVLLHETSEQKRMVKLLFDELDQLNEAGIKFIKVKVL